MTRPRPISFHSLEVHRPAQAAAGKAAAVNRPSFAELLRLRRGPVLPTCAETGAAAATPPGAVPGQPSSDTAQGGDDAEDDDRDDPRHGDAAAAVRDESIDWVAALATTPAMLATLLQGPAAVDGVRRMGAGEPHPLVAAIADTVARFCNEPAVDHSEGWNVRMPLRDDVLPSTTLDLSVSSCWLQLRFETSSAAARELLFLHRTALVDLLATALNRQRDIAISID